MGSSIYDHGAFLRGTGTKTPNFLDWGFDRTDRGRENCYLGRLLRRPHLPTCSLGFVFHRMGRTLIGVVPAAGATWRESWARKVGNPSCEETTLVQERLPRPMG